MPRPTPNAQRPPLGHCSHLMCICIRGPPAIECFLAHDIVIVAARLFLLLLLFAGPQRTLECWSARAFIKVSFCLPSTTMSWQRHPPTSGDISCRLHYFPQLPHFRSLKFLFFLFYSGQHRKLQSNNKSKNCKCCKHFKYFLLIFVQPSGVCK